jgi:Metallo-beta-lactamase superfamily
MLLQLSTTSSILVMIIRILLTAKTSRVTDSFPRSATHLVRFLSSGERDGNRWRNSEGVRKWSPKGSDSWERPTSGLQASRSSEAAASDIEGVSIADVDVSAIPSMKLQDLKDLCKRLGGKAGNLRKQELVELCTSLITNNGSDSVPQDTDSPVIDEVSSSPSLNRGPCIDIDAKVTAKSGSSGKLRSLKPLQDDSPSPVDSRVLMDEGIITSLPSIQGVSHGSNSNVSPQQHHHQYMGSDRFLRDNRFGADVTQFVVGGLTNSNTTTATGAAQSPLQGTSSSNSNSNSTAPTQTYWQWLSTISIEIYNSTSQKRFWSRHPSGVNRDERLKPFEEIPSMFPYVSAAAATGSRNAKDSLERLKDHMNTIGSHLSDNLDSNNNGSSLSMGDMDVTFLGTASCIPSLTRGVSSLALRYNSLMWMFDCGESTQIQLQKSRVKPSKIKKIFLTHAHGDHSFGLPGVLCMRKYFACTYLNS